ncbi:hypothetical protein ACH5RR_040403 [Cinchona calisaya]|uniref:Disease resistance protein RPM1-like n=1 Tax=Cinchona calisaya TaxID=153742 RepID=A0ABD2XSX4_9GENT
MVETVLSFVLHQLSIFLREEGRLLGGLRQQIQLITDELGHTRAFLKVAEANEDHYPRLKEWIRQVREYAYDKKDVLDDFVLRFAHQHSKRFCGSVKRILNLKKNLRARHRVASEIQSIQTRIKNISEGHQRYQSEYGISTDQVSGTLDAVDNKAWRCSRDDALLVEEAKLVGIDKPKQQLISQLLEGDSKFKVIPVIGMGGLGKTTLVKKIHEDADVRRHFQICAWITVSQTFNFSELLKNLIRKLHEEIKKQVPQSIDSMTGTSELKEFIKDFLQEKRTFEDGCCPNHLKKVAEVILGKCDDLPLAILAISGLLALKDMSRIDEWEMVRLSLGGELEERRGEMTNEAVALDYLKGLTNRSLIQVTNVFYEGVPDTCRIHDLFRNVIVSKCREQNMATVTTRQNTRWPEKVRRIAIHNLYDNSSHESHCFDHLRSLITFESTKPLPQTLLSELLPTENDHETSKIVKEIGNLTQLRKLRITNLRRKDGKELYSSLEKLTNLKELNVYSTGKDELIDLDHSIPSSSSSLQYLRVLKGLRWMRVEEGAMPHLRKLTLEEIPLLEELPLGIQHLRQLQKLELADMSSQLMDKLESEGVKDYQQIAQIHQVIISR